MSYSLQNNLIAILLQELHVKSVKEAGSIIFPGGLQS